MPAVSAIGGTCNAVLCRRKRDQKRPKKHAVKKTGSDASAQREKEAASGLASRNCLQTEELLPGKHAESEPEGRLVDGRVSSSSRWLYPENWIESGESVNRTGPKLLCRRQNSPP